MHDRFIVLHCGIIIELAGNCNFIFDILKLILQSQEMLIGLKSRILVIAVESFALLDIASAGVLDDIASERYFVTSVKTACS